MKIETIAEQLLFATLRIEAPPWVGTGFIVTHKWADDKEGPFLVTNKHVIKGSKSGRITFTKRDPSDASYNPSIGQTSAVTFSQSDWQWTGHPSRDIDIAVLPLAPVTSHLKNIGHPPYFRSIPTSTIPESNALEDFDVVEEILFVGYPSGVYDGANNLPIFRKGITATCLSVDYDAKPVFLIDASVFPGSSGSPVFIYSKGGWTTKKGVLMGGERFFLLGILGNSYSRTEDGSITFQEVPTAVKPVFRTNQMIDLGVVYKARAVVETIELLLRQRGELPGNEVPVQPSIPPVPTKTPTLPSTPSVPT